MNSLKRLQEEGQSIWIDYIRRSLITSGELGRLIDDDGLRGMTSNPTIFEKSIAGSSDYDESLRRLVESKKGVDAVYESLVVDDIRMATDALRNVYDKPHLESFGFSYTCVGR